MYPNPQDMFVKVENHSSIYQATTSFQIGSRKKKKNVSPKTMYFQLPPNIQGFTQYKLST